MSKTQHHIMTCGLDESEAAAQFHTRMNAEWQEYEFFKENAGAHGNVGRPMVPARINNGRPNQSTHY